MHFIPLISFNTGIDIIIPVLQPRVLMHREYASFRSDPWSCGALEGGWHAALLLSLPDTKCLPQWSERTHKVLTAGQEPCYFCVLFLHWIFTATPWGGCYFQFKNGTQRSYSNQGRFVPSTDIHWESGWTQRVWCVATGRAGASFQCRCSSEVTCNEDLARVKVGRLVSDEEVAEEYRKVTLFSWGF